jgi:hypothetical protein
MRGADLKPFVREVIADKLDDIAVVFDNQDSFHLNRFTVTRT